MKLCVGIVVLLFLGSGSRADDGFDLSDALGGLDDPEPATPKPKPLDPKNDGELSLLDAFGADVPATKKPVIPDAGGDGGGGGFNLDDALGPDPEPKPKPDKPLIPPNSGGGGGGSFDDNDLFDLSNGNYEPDGGKTHGGGGGGGYPDDSGYNSQGGGGDQPQEAGSGQIAAIVSAVGVALAGAASSYFAYQKKKLCFKLQGGTDPEMGKGQRGAQSDNQVFSNLLRTS